LTTLARHLEMPILFLVLGLFAAGACSSPSPETNESATEAAPTAQANEVRLDEAATRRIGVRVEPLRRAEVSDALEVPGSIVLDEDRTARVGALVEGVVREWKARVGSRVKKGDILALLHSHEVHDAEWRFRQAYTDLGRARSQLELARSRQARAERMLELKAGSIAQVQDAEAEMNAAEAAVAAAQSAIERSEAHLSFLGLDPKMMPSGDDAHGEGEDDAHLVPVRAPDDGIIVERHASIGAVAIPSDPLFVVSDLSRLWAIGEVPEEVLAGVRLGLPVSVEVRAYPGRSFPARVTYIEHMLDPETRTAQVRCEVANSGGVLKAEMYAVLRIGSGETTSLLTIAADAVQDVDGQAIAFVETEPNVFQARPIQAGKRFEDQIEIIEGLREGEDIVVEGAFRLKSEMLKSRFSD